jgi:RimJ/RimL family protein N-acetyltransferase
LQSQARSLRARDDAMIAHELETERLLLRQWRDEDIDDYAEICADPVVMRYIGGRTFSRAEAWRHMAYLVGHWQLRSYGFWAVEERASGRVVGRLGFSYPDGWPGFEIGWTLGRSSWGRGYATEGARAALDHLFAATARPHVVSLIHPENRASIAVAERLGESLEGETQVAVSDVVDVLVYGISREQWLARRGAAR